LSAPQTTVARWFVAAPACSQITRPYEWHRDADAAVDECAKAVKRVQNSFFQVTS